jgi:hypothetical protein
MTAINNLRKNPFTAAMSWRVMDTEQHTVGELDELPGIYGFQLQDIPQNGTVIVVEDITGGDTWDNVTINPLPGQVRIDYVSGYCIFNIADDGMDFLVDYSGGGSNSNIDNIISLIQNNATILGDLNINGDLYLISVAWDDLRILPGAFTFAGASDPTLENWQPGGSGSTFKIWKFQKNDEVFASCQMPHSYKEGTDVCFHIHWTPADRGNEESGAFVGWKVDYSVANIGGNFGASATVDLSSECSGVDDRHELGACVTVSGTGLEISHIFWLRIYRSDTGGDDTWAGATTAQSPALLEFDIHFQMNTLGSREELTK